MAGGTGAYGGARFVFILRNGFPRFQFVVGAEVI
jgi:hypothetical protein